MRAAAKHALPILPLLPTLLLPPFSSFPSVSEQNGGPKKALNPQIRGTVKVPIWIHGIFVYGLVSSWY